MNPNVQQIYKKIALLVENIASTDHKRHLHPGLRRLTGAKELKFSSPSKKISESVSKFPVWKSVKSSNKSLTLIS